jgi:hypothetical protein
MSVGFGIGRIARSFPPRRFQALHHLISILLDAYMQCIYIRFYIGQSLRKDLARKESGPVAIMAESLRRHGVSDAVIEEAVAEAMTKNP